MTMLFDVTAADVAETTDDYYTPRWIFDAAGLVFDMDVAAPVDPTYRSCPARHYLTPLEDGLTQPWNGLVWMNPPYSAARSWVERFVAHRCGLALVLPTRSPWIGPLLQSADAVALLNVAFLRPGRDLGTYRTLLLLTACGAQAVDALARVARADKYTGESYHVRPGMAS